MNSASSSISDITRYLRTPQAVRDRCQYLFDRAIQDESEHFRCHLDQLDTVAEYVIQVTREAYPDFLIPFHSRWRHFEVGSDERMSRFYEQIQALSPIEQTRVKFDLAVVSVLLDAGAGREWNYTEPETGLTFSRSEGLAIASFNLFRGGAFSSNPDCLTQVDANGLKRFNLNDLKTGFQISQTNPLVGIEGRVNLLHRLGDALTHFPHLFGHEVSRPGYLADFLMHDRSQTTISASAILIAVLEGLSSIWPGRYALDGINLGDVWPHPALPQTDLGSHLVPFHKLSQWLTYSLLEPLNEAGFTVIDLESLTGLPEYRNGGLFIDLNVLQPKHSSVTEIPHSPGSSVIVEWRSLTVILLDKLAQCIRQQLNMTVDELPFACILQGGTWSAGRKLARECRPDGIPPIQIKSDGTVF